MPIAGSTSIANLKKIDVNRIRTFRGQGTSPVEQNIWFQVVVVVVVVVVQRSRY
jgi:hypothetical protein